MYEKRYNCLINEEIKTYNNRMADILENEEELKQLIELSKLRKSVKNTIDSIIKVID